MAKRNSNEIVKRGGGIASNLISESEMVERENKYLQRLTDVGVSSGFIKESTMELERLERERMYREHWDHHLRCDGLPRPYLPPEMRTFLAKKRHYQQWDADHSVDWTLSVDERSVLSQNIFRVDRTRPKVKEQLNDHIEERFEQDIFMYLATLNKIDSLFDNGAEMERFDIGRQIEIMEARKEVESEIDDCFDRLTYRIIRMDGVYMNSKDAVIAKWSHKCAGYAIDIWGLRNVPIRFNEMPAPLMVAELGVVGVDIQMPLSVLHDCLTLRCIHTKFDNCSQYAKSFDPIIPDMQVEVNAGIADIEDCLVNEWLMQLDIQQELLNNMQAKRANYEEAMALIAEKTEKAAKEKKANEGKAKTVIPKPPREPPQVPIGMVPDAYPTFLEREQQQYEDMLEDIYNPRKLKLTMDEINMRQHIMLGGLYSISFVRRSNGTHFEKFNIMLHEDGRILHLMDLVADLRDPNGDDSPHERSSKLDTKRSRIRMDEQMRQSFKLEKDELPYFFVTIHMPNELCMWGDPVPCQYVTSEEDVVSEEVSFLEEKRGTFTKTKKHKIGAGKAMVIGHQPSISEPNNVSQKSLLSNVYRPTLISMLRASRKPKPGERVVPMPNFHLLEQLNHNQIRQLERYCVPRIISSFKFPLEIREELVEQFDQRPKTKNMLMRRRSAEEKEEKVVIGELDFDYEVQQAAERMFPVYEKIEHVPYDLDSIQEKEIDKNTVYGLLETLDVHTYRYTTRHKDIINRPDFEIKKQPSKRAAHERRLSSLVGKLKRAGSSMRTSRSSGLASTSGVFGVHRTSSRFSVSERSSVVTLEKLSPDKLSLIQNDSEVLEVLEEKKKELVTHWTTKHILAAKFDRQARTMTIKTDRLGIFGFAYKRYDHFPFHDWSMHPNEENNEEIVLTVDTFRVRVVLYITAEGVRGFVTDKSSAYVAKQVKYLEITTPISDMRDLRKRFYEKNVNIFAENDACFYIDNGYFSVKHVATENHIYDAMAIHCKSMKFYRSSWNRLASRRNVLMCTKIANDKTDYTEVTLHITPDNVTFVEVSELCSDDLDVIKLDFKPTWRNMANFTDLHQAVISMNPNANDARNKDPLLLFQVKRMLNEIRIMSFS